MAFQEARLGLAYGMSEGQFRRLVLIFLGIQAVLWTKLALFTLLFGKGVSAGYYIHYEDLLDPVRSAQLFALLSSSTQHLLEALFHQPVHLLMGWVVFSFAARATRTDALRLLTLFVLGSVAHNFGYWFTGAFLTPLELALDFTLDIILLGTFFYACRFICQSFPQAKKISL